jgi:maleylpyruvate isomerase
MILHDYFRSTAAFRVRIALNLKNLSVEHRAVHLLRGEHRQADYLSKNPQGLVPTLELNDGALLTQSLAIIEYLDALHPEPRLIPENPLLAAKARAVALTIGCDIHPLNNLRVLDYLKTDLHHGQDETEQWIRHWTRQGLDAVERLIAAAPFCFGEHPTLADVCLIPQLFSARRFNASFDHLPKICAVEAHCEELPAFRAAHPSQQPGSA